MKVILTENIETLGIIGKEVNVADGYARNFLFPKRLAVIANDANMKALERKRIRYEAKVAKDRSFAQDLAAKLSSVTCVIAGKVHEDKRLYGSVAVKDIVEKLAEMGFELSKSTVRLEEPIKALGTYKVPIKLFADVKTEITVEVVPQD
ncbi:MAG: 50S ribosomal protein L9 [Deltaproteobacteria bacterium]|nr:50S ribosomal protein L9 [Deltaproteobacteria bacterium]